MFQRLCVIVLLCLLPVCSCSKGDRRHTDVPFGGPPAHDFCVRFIDALCEHYERCACQAEVVEACREQRASCDDPEQGLPTAALVASGEVVYHAEAFAKLEARLRDPKTSCEGYFADLGLDSVSVYSFGGVFEGTRELGAACTPSVGTKGGINGCKGSALCLPSKDGRGRCVATVARGQECDLGPDPPRVCFDQRPPDNDNEFESAWDVSTCVASAPDSKTGLCRAELEDGAPCNIDESCKSRRCSEVADKAVCAPKLQDGAPCSDRVDCQSGACGAGTCGAPFPDGVACSYDDGNCRSGSCHTPDNQSSGQSPGLCGVRLAKKLGDPCTQSYECESRVCRDDHCRNRVCR